MGDGNQWEMRASGDFSAFDISYNDDRDDGGVSNASMVNTKSKIGVD